MDKILYKVISEPGGVDGMAHKDKGGKLVMATFKKELVIKKCIDTRYRWESSVIDTDKAIRAALWKLDEVDKLVLGL